MKLSKLIKFRHLRFHRLTRLQIIIRALALSSVLCLIMSLICFRYIEKDYVSNVRSGEITAEFTEYLTVHAFNTPLYILPSDDDSIKVKYVCDSDIDIYNDGGRLIIEQAESFAISLFAAQQLNYKIEVYLPQKSYKSIHIITNTAAVKTCALDTYMLNVKSKDGYVNIEDVSCSGFMKLDFDRASADIYVSDFSGGELVCRSGTVNLQFADEVGVDALFGSRCYLNGLAYSENNNGSSAPSLSVTAAKECKVRINTSFSRKEKQS